MSGSIIEVDRISKRFMIEHRRASRYDTMRDTIAQAVRKPLKWLATSGQDGEADAGPEEFWALKDISFVVEPGERVGIIGRNGAGKSTLLKVLSRITPPTSGCARIRGRVASLLEVGTGFHPELTGRENIFLNGSILGMAHAEIADRFDEIVEFSGVEQFLDTPVKRYSSGMYVRLAFAVAAFLDPDVLIVDEVLAVGDAEFQRKCLNRLRELEREERTVLFVSHNLAAVSNLCSKVMVLNKGEMLYPLGDVFAGLQVYGALQKSLTKVALDERTDRQGGGKARFVSIDWHCNDDPRNAEAITGRPLTISF